MDPQVMAMGDPERRSTRIGGRLFAVADLIARYPRVYTARRLADELQVSVRTIRRDIQVLESMDMRIESEPSGGYFTTRDLRNLPVALTTQESIAVELIPSLLQTVFGDAGVSPLVRAYASAIEKVARRAGMALPSHRTLIPPAAIVASAHGHATTPQGDNNQAPNQWIVDISQAIAERKTLEMEYYGISRDAISFRRIDPYYLVPWQSAFYIVAWCHAREAFRTFKLLRIRSLRVTTWTFERAADFVLNDFLQQAWGIDQSGDALHATLVFDTHVARYVREEIQDRRLIVESVSETGEYTVQLRAQLTIEFLRFILQFGSHVEVREPPLLRDAVRTEIEHCASRYHLPGHE
jgi:predicted DNA-binding transcriptional regulator YafY